jgi:signal transduction histidine kinase
LTHANDGEPAAEALRVAQDVAKSLLELSHRVHPARLRLIGLVPALDRLCIELSRTGIAITFTHDDVPSTLPPDVMLCLFRRSRSAAERDQAQQRQRALRDLRGGLGGLILTISDDGPGFGRAIRNRIARNVCGYKF